MSVDTQKRRAEIQAQMEAFAAELALLEAQDKVSGIIKEMSPTTLKQIRKVHTNKTQNDFESYGTQSAVSRLETGITRVTIGDITEYMNILGGEVYVVVTLGDKAFRLK